MIIHTDTKLAVTGSSVIMAGKNAFLQVNLKASNILIDCCYTCVSDSRQVTHEK